ADVAHALVQVGDEVTEFLAGQRFDRHDGAVLDELLVGLLSNDLLDADRAQNLHRPLRDLRGTRVNGGAPVVLDGKRRNAVMAEQHRRGHAHETAADDQDWNLDDCQLPLPTPKTSQLRTPPFGSWKLDVGSCQ